mgnify:CR=1 FL=1
MKWEVTILMAVAASVISCSNNHDEINVPVTSRSVLPVFMKSGMLGFSGLFCVAVLIVGLIEKKLRESSTGQYMTGSADDPLDVKITVNGITLPEPDNSGPGGEGGIGVDVDNWETVEIELSN